MTEKIERNIGRKLDNIDLNCTCRSVRPFKTLKLDDCDFDNDGSSLCITLSCLTLIFERCLGIKLLLILFFKKNLN